MERECVVCDGRDEAVVGRGGVVNGGGGVEWGVLFGLGPGLTVEVVLLHCRE